MEDLALIGYGDLRLTDLVEGIGDSGKEEEMIKLIFERKSPPVYREVSKCSQKQLEAHVQYSEWLNDLLAEHEKWMLEHSEFKGEM